MPSYQAIVSVNGSPIAVQPASMEVELQTISASDAGRTADTKMHKKSLREIVAVSLTFANLHTAVASSILHSFMDNEYFTMQYLDPYVGGYATKTFYIGNRTVPVYNTALDIWGNIAFKVVER